MNSRYSNAKFKDVELPSVSYGAADAAKSLASVSFNLAKSVLKASTEAVATKHVRQGEIIGAWRIEQTIKDSSSMDQDIIEAVTIRFLRNGTLVAQVNGIPYQADYSFVARSWPRYCTIKFSAPTHIDPNSRRSVLVTYVGNFIRPLFSNDIILLRGTVHRQRGNFMYVTVSTGECYNIILLVLFIKVEE